MPNRHLVTSLLIAGLAMCSVAMSSTQAPHELIERTVKKLNLMIEEGHSYYQEDPQRLHAKVNDLLENFFDFHAFAKGVMGTHFSASSQLQRTNFAAVLRRTLVQTFTDGLVSMGTYSFEISASKPPRPQSKKTKVTMQVTTSDKVRHVLDYSLAQDHEGSWRVRNVIFDGVNIGLTFRNQFDSEVTNSAGSIEGTINNWELTID